MRLRIKDETFGVLGAVFELVQIYLLGNQNMYGFIFGMFACLAWITFSLRSMSAFGLLFVCPVALILNIRGFWMWG